MSILFALDSWTVSAPIAVAAAVITLLLASSRERSAQAMWVIVGGLVVFAALAYLTIGEVPLFIQRCGPRCGRGTALRPIGIAGAAIVAGLLLTPTRLFGQRRGQMAIVTAGLGAFAALLIGADTWNA